MFIRRQSGHHLIQTIHHILEEGLKGKGFISNPSPGRLHWTLSDGETAFTEPGLAVYGPRGGAPLLIADVDLQACGPQESFSERIRIYSEGGVSEYWIIYPKDRIVVVRKGTPEGGFSKPTIFDEGESIPCSTLPVSPVKVRSILEH
jgi:hypothetical protein